MIIPVEYQDFHNLNKKLNFPISFLVLAKHMAIVGQHYEPNPKKILRSIGIFLHYMDYMKLKDFNVNKFSEPNYTLYDPTEKGQFSNIVGKAIADFLSKKIDQSIYTVNYESAMKIIDPDYKSKRPDLLAFNNSGIFAVEAKGMTESCGPKAMNKHIAQSQSGPISVDFSVASVSFKLYKKIQNKYHKSNTNLQNIQTNIDKQNLLFELSKNYYKGLLGFLNPLYFNNNKIKTNGEEFYSVDLLSKNVLQLYPNIFGISNNLTCDFLENCKLKLILPSNIESLAVEGLNFDTKPFIFETNELKDGEQMYIDNDRVGLSLNIN